MQGGPGSLPGDQEQAHFDSGLPKACAAADRHAVSGAIHVRGLACLCAQQLEQAPETSLSSDKTLYCKVCLSTPLPQEK